MLTALDDHRASTPVRARLSELHSNALYFRHAALVVADVANGVGQEDEVNAFLFGVVDFFGIVSDNTLKAGINFVNPFAKVVKFSVQTKELKENMSVLSREGLTIGLEISALYRLEADSVVIAKSPRHDGLDTCGRFFSGCVPKLLTGQSPGCTRTRFWGWETDCRATSGNLPSSMLFEVEKS